jgi:hypothetical protein
MIKKRFAMTVIRTERDAGVTEMIVKRSVIGVKRIEIPLEARGTIVVKTKNQTDKKPPSQTSQENLTKEKLPSRTNPENLIKENPPSQTSQENLTKEKPPRRTSPENLIKENSPRRTCPENLTKENPPRWTSPENLTKEKEQPMKKRNPVLLVLRRKV